MEFKFPLLHSAAGLRRRDSSRQAVQDFNRSLLLIVDPEALQASIAGAFTDAKDRRAGKFELASGGTLFLDEVGDLTLEAQAKLLRVLQEHEVTRLGGIRPTHIDARVVSATNKDLERAVRKGEFREDLYWRLNVVIIKLPPLRERREDLPLLIDYLLDRFHRDLKLSVKSVSPEARALLMTYDWPGNIRELENTLCRAMILCEGNLLSPADLPPRIRGELPPGSFPSSSDLDGPRLSDAVAEATERLEKMIIVSRLARHKGNRTATAESLGISRKTLFNKMRQYSLGADDREEL